jgi:23S rRNA (uracil1939-C5)-methyltransferase
VVFVPFTAPGDLVRVKVHDERRRFARAQVQTLIEPSPSRTDPVCSVFGTCGGCAWQHIAYPAQLEAKRKILSDALSRIAGLDGIAPERVVPSPAEYGYRGRTRLRVQGRRIGYRRRRSHALCPVTRCPVLVPELDRHLVALAEDPPQRDGSFELAAAGGATRMAPLPGGEGEPLWHALSAGRMRVSPGVFFQSNALLMESLCTAVVDAAGTGKRAIELFAGAGLFTLGLARRFDSLVAVESSPAAVADLEHNLGEAGIRNVKVICERLDRTLDGSAMGGVDPDVIVLDPPRSGLEEGGAEAVAALGAGRIVYLSCEPATLARDLALMVRCGYEPEPLRAFDLFPQTPHVEALAVLERDPYRRR